MGFWFLVSGFWFLVSGFWFLVSGFWFLVSGFWFLVSGLVSGCWMVWCGGMGVWYVRIWGSFWLLWGRGGYFDRLGGGFLDCVLYKGCSLPGAFRRYVAALPGFIVASWDAPCKNITCHLGALGLCCYDVKGYPGLPKCTS